MGLSKDDFRTPGQLIQHLLVQRGWSQKVLAIVLGLDQTVINKVIKGTRPLDAEMALALSEVFGIAAEQFVALQRDYDLALARLTARPDPTRATRAQLFGGLPVAEMITRGWLEAEDMTDVPRVEAALAKFFDVASPDEIEILPHAAKKTAVATDVTPAQLAWLYRLRRIAREVVVPSYSTQAMLNAIKELRALLASPEEARRAPRILAEAGVRFVVVESLTSAKMDGACFWLNDVSPVIGVSLRHDRIDNFWFVLRHECEHVLRGHGRATAAVDIELEKDRAGTGPTVAEQERVANGAAADFCVPAKDLQQFVARKSPLFTERDILGFARTLNVHPGLVAGQLQHVTARYDRFRTHLVKIRNVLLPSALHDGWGDVVPVAP
jgi:HTH-type transcriptional regulator/antitoxin HigA